MLPTTPRVKPRIMGVVQAGEAETSRSDPNGNGAPSILRTPSLLEDALPAAMRLPIRCFTRYSMMDACIVSYLVFAHPTGVWSW